MNVSINGVDGIGKSTQVRLLSLFTDNIFHFPRSLDSYSNKWPKLKGSKFSHWWFEEVKMRELIDIFIESLNKRSCDLTPGLVTVFDRGINMYKAVCSATWATRDEITLEEASHRVEEQFSKKIKVPTSPCEILLTDDVAYTRVRKRYAKYLATTDAGYTKSQQERYRRYQSNLRLAIDRCFDSTIIRVQTDASVLEIQNHLRTTLNDKLDLKIPLLAEHIKLVVGYGGLSESGKSTYAESFRVSCGFYRLKIKYFATLAEKTRKPADVDLIGLEMLKFMHCPHPKTLVGRQKHLSKNSRSSI